MDNDLSLDEQLTQCSWEYCEETWATAKGNSPVVYEITPSSSKCPDCGANMYSFIEDHAAGDTICAMCGVVVDSTFFPELPFCDRRPKSLAYNRSFYLNELLALFTLQGPWIPEDIFICMEMGYNFGVMEGTYPASPKNLTCMHVTQICRSVTVPSNLTIKYTSTRRQCKPLKTFTKYAERYIQIKSRLCNKTLVLADEVFVVQARIFFHCLQVPFLTFIYNGPPPYGRHNWPNYNLALLIACERFGYPQYKKWFPLKSHNRDRLSHYCDIYFKMFQFLQWPPTPLILKYTSFVYQAPSYVSGSPPALHIQL